MERSEPTLVPEWLKSTGSVTGGGSTTHHFTSSSLHSDDHTITLPTRSRSSVSTSDYDTPCSVLSDRTSSSYFRRSSSSNGSMMHDKDPSAYSRSYSSSTRCHRDRDWEKEPLDYGGKERSVLGDYRGRHYSDPLENILASRIEKDKLRHSQLKLSGKRGEVRPRRAAAAADLNSVNNSNHNSGGHLLVGGSVVSGIQKAVFERDFPSLGAEERQGPPDIGRVPSPGLSTAVQSLPIGSSTVIGGDGWTSALAEMPVIIGSNSTGLSSVQQTAPASSTVGGAPSTMTGLNMAETLAQAPSRTRTTPQLSVDTQRLEELAIKQSRQLIPMTPSMPKPSVLSPSDKPKPKAAARTGEMNMATKTGPQQLSSSHLVNHSLRGGPVRSDVPKTSQGGKLHVLKPARENGVIPTANDGLSPTNGSRIVNNLLAVAPTAPFAPRSPNNPKLATAERKAAALAATHGSSLDKRPTMSQAQSRNAFFDLVRKKTSTNLSSVVPDLSPVVSSPILGKSGELIAEVATDTISPQGSEALSSDPSEVERSAEYEGHMTGNGNSCEESQRFSNNVEKPSSLDAVVDEEEVAFLRSLGWEENAGEEEGLTEEEINNFYQQCLKLRPSLKLYGNMQPKLSISLESHVGSSSRVSSGLTSSDSNSEA